MTDREREELRSQVERLQEALQHLLNWVPEPYSGDWDTPRGRAIEAARGLIQNVSRGRNMTDRYWEGYRDGRMDALRAAQSKNHENFSAEICAETGHIRMEDDGPCIFCDAPATEAPDPYDEYCEEHGTSGGGEPGGVWRKSHCPESEVQERGYVEPLEPE